MGAKIGILGAGLAGISAARSLGGNTICEVFERETRVGGLCRSIHTKGYIFDYGPHVFYTKSQFVKRLVGSALKRAENRLAGKPRRAYIYLDGVYVKYPFEANLYPLSDMIKKECIDGARNRQTAAGAGNFLDWISSTFGDGIAKHYMTPYNEKIWKYPLSKMNTNWIEGRVPAPSLDDIIRGANEKKAGRDFGGNKYFHYPLYDGTGAIPAALTKGVRNISCGFEAKEIGRTKNGVKVAFKNGKKGEFNKIISTLPLPELVARLDDVPSEIVRATRSLVHNSSVCVNIGIDRRRISDKHWLYFPEKKYVFNRISFPGNFSSNTVPTGKSSVLTEVTFRSDANRPPKPKEYYVEKVVDGLKDAGILRTGEEPEAVDVAVLEYAYVVYDLQHAKNVNLVRQYLEGIGIFTAGRFGEWEYLNMDGAILSGKKTAERLLLSLEEARRQ